MDELKSELELRKSSSHKNSPNAAVENLKKELQSVVERNKAGSALRKLNVSNDWELSGTIHKY